MQKTTCTEIKNLKESGRKKGILNTNIKSVILKKLIAGAGLMN